MMASSVPSYIGRLVDPIPSKGGLASPSGAPREYSARRERMTFVGRERGADMLLKILIGTATAVLCAASCVATPSPIEPPANTPRTAVSAPASASAFAPAPESAPAPAPASASAAPSASAATPTAPSQGLRSVTSWSTQSDTPHEERVRQAEAARRGVVQKLFADAGVSFPPAELLFRTFKQERELEVWAASHKGAAMTRVATYEICRMSGELGPKRREGDMQVPEGFYRIQYYWPISNYHLEMKVGYPNASDRVLGGREPGGDIMIHGSCASIGCIAMGDERIEELWVMGTSLQASGERAHVHVFPARDMAALALSSDARYQAHKAFWANIKEGLDLFEKTRRLPKVSIDWRGRYAFQ